MTTSECPVKKCVMTPNGGEAMRQFKMSSKKVVNCYHESQQLDERTRFYHLGFIMKMVCDIECSSRVDEWRIATFSLELFLIRRTPRHAEGHHLFFFWSYPIYKSFSLWKQHKAIFKMKIILLLLDEKQGDSEQHGCFSLVLFTPSHPILQ